MLEISVEGTITILLKKQLLDFTKRRKRINKLLFFFVNRVKRNSTHLSVDFTIMSEVDLTDIIFWGGRTEVHTISKINEASQFGRASRSS